MTLHSGLLERSARATVTFPDNGASPAVNTRPTRHAWLYAVVAGLVALLVGIAGLFVVLRRGRDLARVRTDHDRPSSPRSSVGASR